MNSMEPTPFVKLMSKNFISEQVHDLVVVWLYFDNNCCSIFAGMRSTYSNTQVHCLIELLSCPLFKNFEVH